MIKNARLIDLKTIKTRLDGSLSVMEYGTDIPFLVKRVYYITGVIKDSKRGFHAHKKLKQLLFCPNGSIEIVVDNGLEKKSYVLDSHTKGLILEPCLWREMKWLESNSTLIVLASDNYDENDYIRDYEAFKKYINQGGQ